MPGQAEKHDNLQESHDHHDVKIIVTQVRSSVEMGAGYHCVDLIRAGPTFFRPSPFPPLVSAQSTYPKYIPKVQGTQSTQST